MKLTSKFDYRRFGPDDRCSHVASDDEFWQESAFLCWYDPVHRIGAVWRVGNEPNLQGGGAALWSNLLTPDHSIFHRTDRLRYSPSARSQTGLRAEDALVFEYDPGDVRRTHWTMRDKDASADIVAQDLHTPVALFPETGAIVKEKQAKNHLECAVTVTGVAVLDGRRYDVQGYGYRDHSWGIRHWLAIAGHRWLTGTLGNSKTFAMCSFLHEDGSIFKHGYLCDYREGAIEYSDDIDIVVYMESDCVSHRGGIARMRMSDGTTHRFEFEPYTKAVVSYYGGVACLDVPCRVRSGKLDGFADFEISTNPHRGLKPPFDNLESAFVENGIYRGGIVTPKAIL